MDQKELVQKIITDVGGWKILAVLPTVSHVCASH